MINDEQFGGLSKRDQAEISGKALGGHIFDSLDTAVTGYAGGLRDRYVTDAWQDANDHFKGEDIRPTEDDYPEMHYPLDHHAEGYKATYVTGGPYLNIHDGNGSNIEALHMSEEDRYNPQAVRDRADDYMKYSLNPDSEAGY